MTTYDDLKHWLDREMIEATELRGKEEQQAFVTTRFQNLHTAYTSKQLTYKEYLRLINWLASYQGGKFNDYLDVLAGAAQMGILETVLAPGSPFASYISPEAAQKRSQTITNLTGVKPQIPNSE